MNLRDAYFAFSQDVVKHYGFGYDENLLGDTQRAAAARENLDAFMLKTHFNVHFGWMNLPMAVLPQKAIKSIAPGLDEFLQFQKVRFHLDSFNISPSFFKPAPRNAVNG